MGAVLQRTRVEWFQNVETWVLKTYKVNSQKIFRNSSRFIFILSFFQLLIKGLDEKLLCNYNLTNLKFNLCSVNKKADAKIRKHWSRELLMRNAAESESVEDKALQKLEVFRTSG